MPPAPALKVATPADGLTPKDHLQDLKSPAGTAMAQRFASSRDRRATSGTAQNGDSLAKRHLALMKKDTNGTDTQKVVRDVEIKGTLIGITEMEFTGNSATFGADAKIEALWTLSAEEVQAWWRATQSDDAQGQPDSAEMASWCPKVEEALQRDDEAHEFKSGSDTLWSPGLYLRNPVGKLMAEEKWHKVVFDKEASCFIAKFTVKFTGRFPIEDIPVSGASDPSHRLCIEVCVKRDTNEVKELRTSDNRIFKPKNFALRDTYFLEEPLPCETWKLVQSWESQKKTDKEGRLKLLGVDAKFTDPASSSSHLSYAQLRFYVQVHRSSNIENYREPHLFRETYNSHENPCIVDVRLGVVKVLGINVIASTEPAHTFQADFLLETSWYDPSVGKQRFSDEKTGLEDTANQIERACDLLQKMLDGEETRKKMRMPRMGLRNCYKRENPEVWFKVADVLLEKHTKKLRAVKVTRFYRAVGSFVERFELQRFPLDTQELSIELVDFNAYVDQAELKKRLEGSQVAYALGTRWRNMGEEEPDDGTRVNSWALARTLQQALQEASKQQDTRGGDDEVLRIHDKDFEKCNVRALLRLNSFVKVGSHYFQPAAIDIEKNIEHISGRIATIDDERAKDDDIRDTFMECSPTRFKFSAIRCDEAGCAAGGSGTLLPFLLSGRSSYVNKEDGFALEGEYILSKHVFDQLAFTQVKLSGTLKIYPYVKMILRVRRKWFFYFMQIYMPIFLITSFSFGTLFVQASVTVADRLQVSLTMVAALASYIFVIQQAVPKTSYFSLLDYYVQSSMFAFFCIVLQNTWLGWRSEERLDAADSSNHEEAELAEWFVFHDQVQFWFRWAFIGTWLAWSAGAVVWVRFWEHTKAVRFVEEEPLHRDVDSTEPHTYRRGSQQLREQLKLRKQSTTLIRKQSTGELLDIDERRASRQPEQVRNPHEMY